MTGLDDGLHFATSREAGLQRLQEFSAQAGAHYARYRNTDFGPAQPTAVSRLSPYIRHRLITEAEVLRNVLSQHGLEQADKFVQEVFWRTYFKGHLEHKPWLWSRYRLELNNLLKRLTQQSELAKHYQSAISGTTGIAPFDDWARELVRYNYLHNHARMWFASIWIFTLELPWQLGADFFMQHLLDGDPASNTLSWRWVAGLHTTGKHYLARAENIVRYSDGRFSDVRGLNETAAALTEVPLDTQLTTPSVPVLSASEFNNSAYSLLIHEEDLHWPQLSGPARAIAVLGAVPGRASGETAAPVHAFIQGACAHTTGILGTGGLLSPSAANIAQWVRECSTQTVLTAYPPVGPVRDLLNAANVLLEPDKLQIQWLQRRYDAITWPHCNKGFFALKKRIPELLQDLETDDPSFS